MADLANPVMSLSLQMHEERGGGDSQRTSTTKVAGGASPTTSTGWSASQVTAELARAREGAKAGGTKDRIEEKDGPQRVGMQVEVMENVGEAPMTPPPKNKHRVAAASTPVKASTGIGATISHESMADEMQQHKNVYEKQREEETFAKADPCLVRRNGSEREEWLLCKHNGPRRTCDRQRRRPQPGPQQAGRRPAVRQTLRGAGEVLRDVHKDMQARAMQNGGNRHHGEAASQQVDQTTAYPPPTRNGRWEEGDMATTDRATSRTA